MLRKYEVCNRLGKGAYGIVWQAIDKRQRDMFYLGYCKSVLWPLFHSMPPSASRTQSSSMRMGLEHAVRDGEMDRAESSEWLGHICIDFDGKHDNDASHVDSLLEEMIAAMAQRPDFETFSLRDIRQQLSLAIGQDLESKPLKKKIKAIVLKLLGLDDARPVPIKLPFELVRLYLGFAGLPAFAAAARVCKQWSVLLTDSQRPTSGRERPKGAFRATYARFAGEHRDTKFRVAVRATAGEHPRR